MHSLSELKDLLLSKEIQNIKFNGWQLKVDKDTWTLANDVFYKNGSPQSLKEKGLFDNYKRIKHVEHQIVQARKWRGINCRNRRGE